MAKEKKTTQEQLQETIKELRLTHDAMKAETVKQVNQYVYDENGDLQIKDPADTHRILELQLSVAALANKVSDLRALLAKEQEEVDQDPEEDPSQKE